MIPLTATTYSRVENEWLAEEADRTKTESVRERERRGEGEGEGEGEREREREREREERERERERERDHGLQVTLSGSLQQDYQTYVSRKAQKRQSLVVSLSDRNRAELGRIQREKEELLRDFEEKSAGRDCSWSLLPHSLTP